MSKRLTVVLLTLALGVLAGPTFAAPAPLARLTTTSTGVEWHPVQARSGFLLTISGPDGFYSRRTLAAGEAPSFTVFDDDGSVRPDGTYVYELRAIVSLDDQTRREIEPLRRTGRATAALAAAGLAPEQTVQSGSFSIADGAIALGDKERPEASQSVEEKGGSLASKATILTISDGSIIDSLCVGFDCTSSPPFGDSTVLLEETSVRLKFDDTSTSSYPDRDWELTANDSNAGGVERFSISDCGTGSGAGCADDEVFSVEAGVRENALYVEADGDIGVGTANPAATVHLVTSDSPSLRLEQDGGAGFTPQTWELIGNEVGLLVQDVTAGSYVYPFRIESGAGSNRLVIDDTGRVGIGSLHPTRPLQVVGTGAPDNTVLEISNDGPARMRIQNGSSGETWNIGNQLPSGTGLTFSDVGDADSELLLDVDGNLTITGEIFTDGTCSGGCDLVFDPGYELQPIAEHTAQMLALHHLPAVGPTPEQGPFNLSQMTGGMLNELEKAHLYIDQLSSKNRDLEERLARVEARLQELLEARN